MPGKPRESRGASDLPAVRALLGEPPRVVAGVTFLPPSALDPLLWGTSHEPDELIARACAQLHLDFVFLPGKESWAARAARRVTAAGIAAFWAVDGPFARAADDLGWGEALRLTVAEPSSLLGSLDDGVAAALAEVHRGTAAGAAAIVVAEDLSGASGPLVPPDFVNETLVSRLARIVGEASTAGLPAAIHSDGDVRAHLSAFARAGFSAVHMGGLGETAFVRMLRDARTRGLRTIGGIEGEALRAGSIAAIRAGTRASLFAVAGDLLVADDGSISSPEEFSAFASAVAAARGDTSD